MEQYIIEFSKYFIPLFAAFYTYECFAVFRQEKESDRKGIYIRQNIVMFLLHFVCMLSLYLNTGKVEILFFFAFQEIALFTVIILYQLIYAGVNRLIINNMCMLLAIGFTALTRLSYDRAVKQFVIIAFSLVFSLLVPAFMKKFTFYKLPLMGWVYAAAGITALLFVFIFGSVTNGSKLFFTIFGVSFQPSEFVKILFVFLLAAMLSKSSSFFNIMLCALLAGLHVGVLVFSRDLGSALIFFVVFLFLVFTVTGNWFYLCGGFAAGALCAVISYPYFTHVRVRVQAWRDPFSVIDGAGFQITQSLFAIRNGKWFGTGLYKGSPKSIPYVETDFVFSALTEELGLIFSLCLILICLSCFIMFMNIALREKDMFYKLLAVGFGVTYIFQVFLTIGGGTKFIPLTGVTLPLISYGGSSALSTILTFSIMEGLYMIHQGKEGGKRNAERTA